MISPLQPLKLLRGGADKDLTEPDSSESGDQGSTNSSGKDAGTSGEEDGDASIFDSENNAPVNGTGETGGEEGSEDGKKPDGAENGGTNNTDNNNGGNDGTGSGSGSSGNGQPANGSTEPDDEDSTGAGAGAGNNENNTGNNNTKPNKPEDMTSGGENAAEGTNSATGGTTPENPAEKPAGDSGHTEGGNSTPENDAGNNNATPNKPADVTSGVENAAEGTNSATGGTTPENPQPETEKKPEVEIEEEPEDEPEDELQSYILESITFPGEELISYTENTDTAEAGTEDETEEKGGFLSLFSLFSADETVEESEETEEAEDPQTIKYIERHVEVGDDVKDIKLPNKMVLSLVPVDDESEEVDIATNSDASGNNGNGLKEKFASVKKSKSETKTLRVDLDEDDWIIISPDELSGEGLDAFDTSGVEILDEDGNPTGEYSTEHAVYPQYILVPNLENLSLEDKDGLPIDTDNLLAGPASADIQTYLLNNASARVSVGTRANDQLLGDTVEIALNYLRSISNGTYYSYDNGILTLRGAEKYKLYIETEGISDLNEPPLSIKFDATGNLGKVTLIIDGDSAPDGNISINAVDNDDPAIDISELDSLTIQSTGEVSVNSAPNIEAIKVPNGSTLSLTGGNLSISSNGVGIGVMSGDMGSVSINGNVIVDGGNEVAIGSGDATDAPGNINLSVNSGKVEISGGQRNGKYPLQGIHLAVDPNSNLLIYSGNTNNNDSLVATDESYLIRGSFSNTQSSGIDLTIMEENDEGPGKTIHISDSFRGFMTNVDKAGTYKLSGIQSDGREIGYIGINNKNPEAGTTGEFVVSGGCKITYTDIVSTILPVFWDHAAEISGELTENGDLSIILSAAVDIKEKRSEISDGVYNVGTEEINKYGFYVYQKDEDGNIREDTRKPFTIESSDNGKYSIKVKSGQDKYFIPGETYYVVPFVETNAGIREAEDFRVENNDDVHKNPEIEIVMPKIEFPTNIEFTYGTTTKAAFDAAGINFRDNTEAKSGNTVKIGEVTFTFPTNLDTETDDTKVIWGTNVEDARFILSKPDNNAQNGDWSGVTVKVPDNVSLIYSEKETPDDYFVVEFVAPSQSDNVYGQLKYNNIKKPVAVKVNKKPITLTSIGTSGEKEYDGNTNIIWKDNSVVEFGRNDVVTPFIYGENGAVQDTEADDVSIVIDSTDSNTDAAKGRYVESYAGAGDAADAGVGNKHMSLTNINLTGADAGNYSIEDTATLTNGTISGKKITVSPKAYTLRTGDIVTASSADSKLEIEVANGEEDSTKLKVEIEDFELSALKLDGTKHVTVAPGEYTVSLEKSFKEKNPNYDITLATAEYKVIQEKPKKDGHGHGAYTVSLSDTEKTNGWYSEKVVFAPKTDGLSALPADTDNYYNVIRNASGKGESDASGYKKNFSIHETTEVQVQLKNSENGGYTSIETDPVTYYVDTDDPSVVENGISYEYEDKSLFDNALRLLGFGSFANGNVKVTVKASDSTSGVWYMDVITAPETGSGNPSPDVETKRIYFNGETADIPTASEITAAPEKYKNGTAEFTIPLNFNGYISVKIVDHAGRMSAETKLGNDGHGRWVVTGEKPVIGNITVSGAAYKENGGVRWYNNENGSMPVFTAAVNDAGKAGGLSGKIGLQSVSTKINDNADVSVNDSYSDSLISNKNVSVTLTANDQKAGGSVTVNAANNAGNTESRSLSYNFDSEDPVVDASNIIYWQEKDGNLIRAVINWFSYGQFTSDMLKVKIPVKDNLSGVDRIHYAWLDNSTLETVEKTDLDHVTTEEYAGETLEGGKYIVLTVPLNTKGYIYYYAEDVAGNTSDINVLGKDGANKIWVVEKTPPEINVSYTYDDDTAETVDVVTGGVTTSWYTKPLTVTANITDMPDSSYSGLKSVTYKLGTDEETTETIAADTAESVDIDSIRERTFSNTINTEGTDLDISVSAVDNVGMKSSTNEDSVNIDLNDPVIGNVTRVPEGEDYTNSDITVAFNVTDSYSGVQSVSIDRTHDGSGAVVTSEPVTLDPAEDGDGTLYRYTITANGIYEIVSVDRVGHETTKTFTVTNIDKKEPEGLELSITTQQGADGIYRQESLAFSISAEDNVDADNAASNIAKWAIYNTISGTDAEVTSETYEDQARAPSNLNNEVVTVNDIPSGTYRFKLVVTDFAGNETEYDYGRNVVISNAVPSASITGVSTDNEELTVNVSDITDDPEWISAKELTVRFEVGPKDGQVSVYKSDTATTPFDNKITAVTANDTYSDTITGQGTTEIYYSAHHAQSDKWQNPVHVTVKLDNVAPGAPGISIGAEEADWYNGAYPVITITPQPQAKDTAPEKTYYKIWSGTENEEDNAQEYLEYIPASQYPAVKDNGTYTIKAYTVDEAGNRSETAEKTFKVDITAPSISVESVTTTPDGIFASLPFVGGWFANKTLTVTVKVEDSNSGAASLQYAIDTADDDSDGQFIDAKLREEGSGDYTKFYTFEIKPDTVAASISLKAADNAGNESDAQPLGLNGDTGKWTVEDNAPTLSAAYYVSESDPASQAVPVEDKTEAGTEWFNTAIDLAITVNDADSGLNKVTYSLEKDGEPTVSEQDAPGGSFPSNRNVPYIFRQPMSDGRYVLKMTATDNAGNANSLKQDENNVGISFNIDTTKPEISVPAIGSGWLNSEQQLTFKVRDALSGLYLEDDEGAVALKKDGSPVEGLIVSANADDEGYYSCTFTTTGNGTYTLTASDNAGNTASEQLVISNIDTTAPGEPKIRIDRADRDNASKDGNWYQEIPTVYITPAPAETAGNQATVHTYYYVWNDSSVIDSKEAIAAIKDKATELPYNDTSEHKIVDPFGDDGRWQIVVWGEDEAGNITNFQDIPIENVNIDTIDPVIDSAVNDPDGAVASDTVVTVMINVSEATGVIDVDNIDITDSKGKPVEDIIVEGPDTEGNYKVSFNTTENEVYSITVMDESGRSVSQSHTVNNIAPDEAPAATVTIGGNAPNEERWYAEGTNTALVISKPADNSAIVKNTVEYTVQRIDIPSGEIYEGTLDSDTTQYAPEAELEDGTWRITAITSIALADGETVDKKVSYTVKIDRTKPRAVYVAGNPTDWTMQDAAIYFDVSDNVSGIIDAGISVTKDGGESIEFSAVKGAEGRYVFTAESNGEYVITVKDGADNINTATVDVTKIDKSDATPASFTVEPATGDGSSTGENNEKWYLKTPVINITQAVQSDPGKSPVDTFYILERRDGNDWTVIKDNINLSDQPNNLPAINTDGIYRLTVYTWTDAAQNDYNNPDLTEDIKEAAEEEKNVLEVRYLYVDRTQSGLTSVTAEPWGDDAVSKVINRLTFGNFFNEAIKVTVTVDDDKETTSGPRYVYYEVSESKGEFTGTEENRVAFTGATSSFKIDLNSFDTEDKFIKFYIEDAAGNKSELYFVTSTTDGTTGVRKWMLEADAPEIKVSSPAINGSYTGYDDNIKGWYNHDVTISASIKDAEAGIGKAEIRITDPDESERTVNTTADLSASKAVNADVTAEISGDGTTTFDIYAEDNAHNGITLSEDSTGNPSWAGEEHAESRTIRIDKTEPSINIETLKPVTEWITVPEFDVVFKVSDHVEGKVKGKDYSGVNKSFGLDATDSIRVARVEGETETFLGSIVEAPDVQDDPETDTYYYRVKLEENGKYRFYIKDNAGNLNFTEWDVTWIPKKADVHTPVDVTRGGVTEDEWIHGYVEYKPENGNGNFVQNYDGKAYNWYTELPESINVVNSTHFVVNSGVDNTNPVVTKYAFVNVSVDEFDEDDLSAYDEIGYTISEDENEKTPIPNKTGNLVESIINNENVTKYKDGLWVLFVRNMDEYLIENPEVGTSAYTIPLYIPFFIDMTSPEIELDDEDSTDWETEKTITFKVTDPDEAKEVGDTVNGRSTASGIDTSTVFVTFKGENGENETFNVTPVPSFVDGVYDCSFVADKRGTYTVTVMDKAGNTSEPNTITVRHISDEIPGIPEITVTPTANGGVVDNSDYADAQSGDGWYRIADDGSEAEPVFKLSEPEKADSDAAPITTYYKIWNGTLAAEPEGNTVDNKNVFKGSVADSVIENIERIADTDGQWNIKTWSVSASGVSSLEAQNDKDKYNIETVFVDHEKPSVLTKPESIEVTNEGPVWEALNKLTFGVFFNKELKVKVKVTDSISLGSKLEYVISKADGTAEGTAEVTLDNEDKTEGTAEFTLPFGTKGAVKLTAYDKAGNSSGEANLAFEDGIAYWEIEQQSPTIIDTNPDHMSEGLQINLLTDIQLVFDEWVRLVDGSLIVVDVNGKQYHVADPSGISVVELKEGSTTADKDNIHEQWTVVIPVESFADEDGDPIELVAGATHHVTIKAGAFEDAAGNINNEKLFYFETDEYAWPPEIGDIDITLPAGSIMNPEDFASDHNDYVVLITDNAMSADGSQLAEDLRMNVELENGATHIDRAELTDMFGNVIAGTEEIWTADGETAGHIVIPAEDIKASENYFIRITASQYGISNTYSFFVSTSAISAVSEDVGGIGVSVDTDELIESMRNSLEADALKDWKIVIKFRAASIPVTSAGKELEAVLKALNAAGTYDSSLGFYPLDLTVTETHARTGETEDIDKLEKPVTVKITMPEDSRGREVYGIFRYNESNGTVTKVNYTLSADGSIATLITDDFSGTYAVVYDEKPESTGGSSGGSSGGSGGSGGGGGGGGGLAGVNVSGGTLSVGGTTAHYGGTWINDGYLFTESDGSRPSNEWVRIDGKIYRFVNDGFRTVNYEFHEFNPDGSLKDELPEGTPVRDATGTWLKDGWWYKTVNGGYLAGGWYYLFYQGRFEWYYFNEDGWMLDGWLTLPVEIESEGPETEGKTYLRDEAGNIVTKTYYLHTTHDWTRGRMYTDWHFIDGKWYYFRTKGEGDEGALVTNGVTITGHRVGPDGAWDGVGPAPTPAE